jgi:hypothetical protein
LAFELLVRDDAFGDEQFRECLRHRKRAHQSCSRPIFSALVSSAMIAPIHLSSLLLSLRRNLFYSDLLRLRVPKSSQRHASSYRFLLGFLLAPMAYLPSAEMYTEETLTLELRRVSFCGLYEAQKVRP